MLISAWKDFVQIFVVVMVLYSTSIVKLRQFKAARLLIVYDGNHLRKSGRLHRSLTNILCYTLVELTMQVQKLCGPRLPSPFI